MTRTSSVGWSVRRHGVQSVVCMRSGGAQAVWPTLGVYQSPSPKIGPVRYGQRWVRWQVCSGSFEPAKALVRGLTATPTVDLLSSCRSLPVLRSYRGGWPNGATPDRLVARWGWASGGGGCFPSSYM